MKKVPELVIFAQLMLCFVSIMFGVLYMIKGFENFLYGMIAFQGISFCISIYSLIQKNTR